MGRFHVTFAAALVAIAALAPWAAERHLSAQNAQSITVVSPSGRRAVPTVVVNNHEMVALDDLVPVFQLFLKDDPIAGGMTVIFKDKSIVLMPDQAIASVGGRLVSLSVPVVRDGRRWLVPPDFMQRALALISDVRLEYRPASRLVVVGDLRVPKIAVRQENLGNEVRITFDASPRTGHSIAQEANRLLVRFDADALDTQLPRTGSPGLVDAIRIADSGNTIAITLGPRFAAYRASTSAGDSSASRLVLDVFPAGSIPAPLPATPAPAPPAAEAPTPAPAPGIHAVVIDPGHGGSEDGARGSRGALEKDVTLSVARRLKALVESRLGIRALLTRDGDTTVGPDERAAFANNNKADVFVSIHVNASMRKEVKGAGVFYLSADGYTEAQQAGDSAEALPTFGGGSRDIDVILWEVAQAKHITQSAALAAIVDEELRSRVPMAAHPVQQAPFRVLVGVNTPAVLVEIGFLTNEEQEEAVASPEFQNQVAQALFSAIVRFGNTIERTAGGAPPSNRPTGLQ